jgi:ParB-like chromosome segregation protein Spo0J
MEKKMYELTVDEELERVAPPLVENELEILKADILEHGCRFPLIVWGDMIVDGHNRYRICKEEGIPFGIEEMEFADKTEAKLWIVKNQLGRRNLKTFQRCEMVAPMEEEIKADLEKRRRDKISATLKAGGTVTTVAPSIKSRDIMANMAGVSHTTYSRAKVIIEKADEETKAKLRTEELKIASVFNKLMGKTKEAPAKEPAGDKPPVVAAYLEGSMPFEPVQRDAEPDEIIDALDECIEAWTEDLGEILDKLTAENTSENVVLRIRERLERFYASAKDELNEKTSNMEEA